MVHGFVIHLDSGFWHVTCTVPKFGGRRNKIQRSKACTIIVGRGRGSFEADISGLVIRTSGREKTNAHDSVTVSGWCTWWRSIPFGCYERNCFFKCLIIQSLVWKFLIRYYKSGFKLFMCLRLRFISVLSLPRSWRPLSRPIVSSWEKLVITKPWNNLSQNLKYDAPNQSRHVEDHSTSWREAAQRLTQELPL